MSPSSVTCMEAMSFLRRSKSRRRSLLPAKGGSVTADSREQGEQGAQQRGNPGHLKPAPKPLSFLLDDPAQLLPSKGVATRRRSARMGAGARQRGWGREGDRQLRHRHAPIKPASPRSRRFSLRRASRSCLARVSASLWVESSASSSASSTLSSWFSACTNWSFSLR